MSSDQECLWKQQSPTLGLSRPTMWPKWGVIRHTSGALQVRQSNNDADWWPCWQCITLLTMMKTHCNIARLTNTYNVLQCWPVTMLITNCNTDHDYNVLQCWGVTWHCTSDQDEIMQRHGRHQESLCSGNDSVRQSFLFAPWWLWLDIILFIGFNCYGAGHSRISKIKTTSLMVNFYTHWFFRVSFHVDFSFSSR